MVLIPGAQLDDRAVLVIETLPLPVTLRYLETLFPPEPFYLLVIDFPAFNAKQLGDLPVAIAAILLCQSDQSQPKAVILARLVGVVDHVMAVTDRRLDVSYFELPIPNPSEIISW